MAVGANRVLRGAEQAAVVVGDVVGGAEDSDFGGQFGVGGQDWLGPDGGGGRCPVVDDGVADLVGQLGDQFGAGAQVGAPLRVVGEQGRGGRQPAQRPDPAGVCAGGVDAPVDDGGGVVGAEQLVLGGGGGQRGERVVAVCGDDGQVLAQHRPGLGAGQAGVELVGGDVQLGQRGGGGELVGGFAEGVVVHGGGRTEAGEGVGGFAGCGGG